LITTRAELERAMAGFSAIEAPAEATLRHAAVCLLVVPGEDGLAVALTRRSRRLRAHPGQWALPGGGLDPGESSVEAALRELEEELGIDCAPSQVAGSLDDFLSGAGFRISPVVVWAGDEPFTPTINEDEVSSVHLVRFTDLGVSPRFVVRDGSAEPILQMPLLDHLIHAPTGAILHQFGQLVVHGRTVRVGDVVEPTWVRGPS
jgi:8-oxo-dGTP pyrophosphatase MutT (NUDIX family)